jgi:flagellar basal-body rod protein FlgG
MLRGLYTAASGMMAQMTRQGIVANNLANATTPGYKQDIATQGFFQRLFLSRLDPAGASPLGALGSSAGAVSAHADFAQGALSDTGGELDLALTGDGFFAVQTPDGLQVTRNGAFGRDAEGRLTTTDGALVLGVDGPLTLPPGRVRVEGDGAISVDGQPAGRLQIVRFEADQLDKVGAGRFAPRAGAAPQPATAAVNQGFLEASNVDLTRAVTDMMAASRSYEANQRMLQIQDDLLGKAVNEVGRLA